MPIFVPFHCMKVFSFHFFQSIVSFFRRIHLCGLNEDRFYFTDENLNCMVILILISSVYDVFVVFDSMSMSIDRCDTLKHQQHHICFVSIQLAICPIRLRLHKINRFSFEKNCKPSKFVMICCQLLISNISIFFVETTTIVPL